MERPVAYSSSAPEVVAAWEEFKEHKAEVAERRKAVADKYGRALMVRSDWDHGNKVAGFAMGDEPYDEKAFKVTKYTTLEPRMSTKAGKAVAAELAELNQRGIKFPGMPSWFFGGLRVFAPAVFEHDGTLWLYWADEPDPPADKALWTEQPLSSYYLAKEHEAARREKEATR